MEISNVYNIDEEIYNGEYENTENIVMEDHMNINENQIEEENTDNQNFDFYAQKDNSGILF